MKQKLMLLMSCLCLASGVMAEQPQRPAGIPGAGGPPPPPGQGRPEGGPEQARRPGIDWMKAVDANHDGKFDQTELAQAMDTTFAEIDRNGNGIIDPPEIRRPPRPGGNPGMPNGGEQRPRPGDNQAMPGRDQMPRPGDNQAMPGRDQMPRRVDPPTEERPGPDGKKMLPPFFFGDRVQEGASIPRAEFDRIVRGVFNEMDKNGDGAIDREESHPPKRPDDGPGRPEGPPPPPNARFIGAELRFGEKLVTGQPFSAETVMEDTRRLYDGTTATKQIKGAVYRDSAGRTRREQPLDMVGGVSIAGTDGKPQMLVFINDPQSRTQYFLDVDHKIARKNGLGRNPSPDGDEPREAKKESLGTKKIEGVSAEGTRMTFQIPAGDVGNDKPLLVIDETWFSSELQTVVYFRHVDPLAGEHVFKLVNIRRSEPAGDLFVVPASFRLENGGEIKRDRE